ncbi:MAG: hypothetical protein ACREMP_05230 [Candidatus Tyrphobacter sp.]
MPFAQCSSESPRIAAARSDVRLFAQAIKCGRTLVPVQANIWNADDALVAGSQVTYMRLTTSA